MTPVPVENLPLLIRRLSGLREQEWVEFKVDNAKPDEIGEYISALSNGAVLADRDTAYLIWGVRDHDREIVGTSFDPARMRVGGEEITNWLIRLLSPQVNHSFSECIVDGKRVVILEVSAALHRPTKWKNEAYIRVGSYKKRLTEIHEIEKRLWRKLDHLSFEKKTAASNLRIDEVLTLLDYPSYFDLHSRPLPPGSDGVIAALADEGLIREADDGSWEITNLGGILYAKDLSKFERLARKAPRIVVYGGKNRVNTKKEQVGVKGYASGFASLIESIVNSLPTNEVVEQALRRTLPMYPELAIRELVANALVHQDFAVTGAGPMIEQFDDRLEISNPGVPLLDPARFVDAPPRSRNEKLASQMRHCGICEERGSGWDKVALQIEVFQLPAPLVETVEDSTKVVLFGYRSLAEMDREEKVRAVYLHACLKYVSREPMNNASVRKRFGIEQRNSATASRLISDAVAMRLIAPYDSQASRSQMRYVPFWAVAGATETSS